MKRSLSGGEIMIFDDCEGDPDSYSGQQFTRIPFLNPRRGSI
jgi:hypothetical protein